MQKDFDDPSQEGYLAVSKAGHDKGNIYFIWKQEGEYVYLVDGNLKKINNPKKKNRKHIQIITKGFDKSMLTQTYPGDEAIKRLIHVYAKKTNK